jgi:hypothetical protein
MAARRDQIRNRDAMSCTDDISQLFQAHRALGAKWWDAQRRDEAVCANNSGIFWVRILEQSIFRGVDRLGHDSSISLASLLRGLTE